MTETEFKQEAKTLLKSIDPCLHAFIMNKAWDYGHGHGYNEVLLEIGELVLELTPYLEKFKESVIVEFLASREPSR